MPARMSAEPMRVTNAFRIRISHYMKSYGEEEGGIVLGEVVSPCG
jgi:hypothetical protein